MLNSHLSTRLAVQGSYLNHIKTAQYSCTVHLDSTVAELFQKSKMLDLDFLCPSLLASWDAIEPGLVRSDSSWRFVCGDVFSLSHGTPCCMGITGYYFILYIVGNQKYILSSTPFENHFQSWYLIIRTHCQFLTTRFTLSFDQQSDDCQVLRWWWWWHHWWWQL